MKIRTTLASFSAAAFLMILPPKVLAEFSNQSLACEGDASSPLKAATLNLTVLGRYDCQGTAFRSTDLKKRMTFRRCWYPCKTKGCKTFAERQRVPKENKIVQAIFCDNTSCKDADLQVVCRVQIKESPFRGHSPSLEGICRYRERTNPKTFYTLQCKSK